LRVTDAAFLLATVCAIFLLAGVLKGVVGFGLPTVSMGLMSLFLTPVEAAAVLVVPTLVTNIWQMFAGPALLAMVRRFATLNAGIMAGTFLTIGLLTGPSTAFATGALGAVLAAYAGYGFVTARIEVRPASERWLSPLVGLVTGMLCGATGVFVIPVIPYLSAVKIERDELIQAVGVSAFVSPLALGIALLMQGRYEASLAGPSFLAVLPAMAGMYFGQRIRGRIPPAAFRRWFFLGMLALGAYMFLRALR
jgi:uncharacterized membrane protein YfcA